jgi:chorismate dehydratase
VIYVSTDRTEQSFPPGTERFRIGGIDYLNAQPLVRCVETDAEPSILLERHRPNVLADRLGRGQLDAALLPVIGYFDRPAEYWIVPGICIASHGPVRSIRLYHRRPLSEVRSVALDASSRTSVILTRVLFAERWGSREVNVEFVTTPPDVARRRLAEGAVACPWDAVLLIGDDALSSGRFDGWREVDLGLEWTSWTGLPFVYAFWVVRPPRGGADADDVLARLVERLRDARWRGFARIDEIVREVHGTLGLTENECRDYLVHTIRYDLGDDERRGLDAFIEKARQHGYIPDGIELRFLPLPRRAEEREPALRA